MEITRKQYRDTFAKALSKEMKVINDNCNDPDPMVLLGCSLFAAGVVKRIKEEIFGKEEEEPAQEEEDVDVLPFN